MPLYKDQIAQELEGKKNEFSGVISEKIVDEYQNAVDELFNKMSRHDILNDLEGEEYPGSIPTKEFEQSDGFLVAFEESNRWGSHEAVNQWARSKVEAVTTIAADGSQISPIKDFEKTVGLVQVVWIANNHSNKGEYEEEVETKILTPEDLLFEDPKSCHIKVDEREVPLTRFETEMKVLEKQIKKYSDVEKIPVVMYDGPLVLTFAQMFSDEAQKRYSRSLSRLLAASKYHEVPVIGYTAGSKASDLSKMIKTLDLVGGSSSIRDYQLLDDLFKNWGDRTVVFNSQRDSSLNWLKTTYHGKEYDFSDDILFTYLKTNSSPQPDRIDFPRWIQEEGLVEYVLNIIRAETGVGRGYPEILQSADTDAVIKNKDRKEFLRMYQEFSDKNDIDLRWNNKSLSKKRRRR